MFEGYRVVCVTPAGRRRYMQLLVPQILASDLVDRYDIWLNTEDAKDRGFLEGLAEFDRVRLLPVPGGVVKSVESICGFHRDAIDEDTIYVRLDDDVVWLEPGFFEALLRFRIDHPEYFLVMPLIVNNALCSWILQSQRKIAASKYIRTYCMDGVGWRNPHFAASLHRLLLDLIRRGETQRLHSGSHVVSLNRFSINCICWFGRDLAQIGGEVAIEEEEDLSAVIPARLGRLNCFFTDTIAAHFAFLSQRRELDQTGILEEYRQVLEARPEIRPLLAKVVAIREAAEAKFRRKKDRPGGIKVRQRRSALWHFLMRQPRPRPQPPVELIRGPML